jgi:hypothetical protein
MGGANATSAVGLYVTSSPIWWPTTLDTYRVQAMMLEVRRIDVDQASGERHFQRALIPWMHEHQLTVGGGAPALSDVRAYVELLR